MKRVALAFLVACGGGGTGTPKPVIPLDIPAPAIARFIVGGDSRNDVEHVLPWAFQQARYRKATAFVFLGDMELTSSLDDDFEHRLKMLGPVPFYPVLGNHEVKTFGFLPSNKSERLARFRTRFLDKQRTPVTSALPDRIVYSVNLAGGVHLVALDNVSQKGFGADQLAWIDTDLKAARADASVKFIIVGMHKALAKNGVTKHAMDEDGDQAVADSDTALARFVQTKVDLVIASHVHEYAKFVQAGIPSYITGGLGAPLSRHASKEQSFHHFLQVEVTPGGLDVSVVRFEGGVAEGDDDDSI